MHRATKIFAAGLSLALVATPLWWQTVVAEQAPTKESLAQPQGANDLLPPNAKAGECYARVYTPPVYKTEVEQVERRAASETLKIIPAKFAAAEEKVIVREASKKLELVPATYGWEEEQVVVKPVTKVLKQVPATFETATEQVKEQEGYTYWKKGRGPVERMNDSTGEIMCLVEVPAVYKTITKKVLKAPARTEEVEIPAVTTTVKKHVMKTPPTTREIEIPAEYKVVKVSKLVEPAKEVRIPIPAEIDSITKTVKVSDARLEWRSILCETNMTQAKIVQIQQALKTAGYNPGLIDGQVGRDTIMAMNLYQKDHKLPIDNLVNMDTVRALNVGF